jgi:hypothetical protein
MPGSLFNPQAQFFSQNPPSVSTEHRHRGVLKELNVNSVMYFIVIYLTMPLVSKTLLDWGWLVSDEQDIKEVIIA